MARISRAKWAEERARYRRGEASLREIAKDLGVALSTVSRRATKERWSEERARTADAAQTRAAEKDVESLASMLSKHRRIANRLLAMVEKRLDDAVADGKVSANLIDTMAQVLGRAARQERLAAGIEPAKPVTPSQQAGQGTEIVIERNRNPAVAAPAATGT